MQSDNGNVRVSATDLSNHLSCRHLTALEVQCARGEIRAPPPDDDPRLEALRQRGFEHEASYLSSLAERGIVAVRAEATEARTAAQHVQALMEEGVDAITQARLGEGWWHGRPDLLLRVERPSRFGHWSYDPLDMKLARQTKGETILQLCVYAELLEAIQGCLPQYMHVVTPGPDGSKESYRTDEYIAYARHVKRALGDAVDENPETYPEPVQRCDTCRWLARCNATWRADDHLSLVAGLARGHRQELTEHGITTVAGLAAAPLPLPFGPRRGATETYERLREQARVQVEQRDTGEPVYELLPVEPERGLALLPEPSEGDVFFDIEGDPFVGHHGLEYLLGWLCRDDDGQWRYHVLWAMDGAEERRAFERFVDEMEARWHRYPDFHIYHFGAYEPGALKRLMGRHATREDAIDRMLRGRLFVDLHTVVRQGVRAGVERYSLKDLEVYHGLRREVALPTANRARVQMEVALEVGDPMAVPAGSRELVRGYNEDDCRSTQGLRDWLEALRTDLLAEGTDVPRPAAGEPDPGEELSAERERVRALMEALTADVPEFVEDQDPIQHGRWLLAQLLDWERREDKVAWWELFRLADLELEALFEERQAVAGLRFEEEVPASGRTPVHRYRFPEQEVAIREGDQLRITADRTIGTVAAIDRVARTVDVKKRQDADGDHPEALFAFKKIDTAVLSEAVMELGEWVRDHGVDAAGRYRAARDLLLARPPRRRAGLPEALRHPDEPSADAAVRLVGELDGGVLAIQGPPGTGKSTTGARMILAAVQAGLRVGVTANSHKVIENLIHKAAETARREGVELSVCQKVTTRSDDVPAGIQQVTRTAQVLDALATGEAQVGAGTAWLWARPEFRESVDVLFVDEAGQLALARTLAVSLAARNVVLLGDPGQLEQPVQGSHPEGTDVSAMEHLLDGEQTLPADRGLFLETSYRLHPSICEFTSRLFYECRLAAAPGLEGQCLVGESPFAGAGLWRIPVPHQGNQVSAPEEVDAVVTLLRHLAAGDVEFEDSAGNRRPLTLDDILVVAPYNSHVAAIAERVPKARVGTVDRFQGQEAPVVVYSMASSSPEDAPRGMGFLYSASRMNVATSRAQAAAILVHSPELLTPDCRTPEQIRLANAFCAYAEMARVEQAGG